MYEKYALIYGNIISYGFMGECSGEKYYEFMYNFWHKKYLNLGYNDINFNVWINAGGYGSTYKHLLKQK